MKYFRKQKVIIGWNFKGRAIKETEISRGSFTMTVKPLSPKSRLK